MVLLGLGAIHAPSVQRWTAAQLQAWLRSQGIESRFVLHYNLPARSVWMADLEAASKGGESQVPFLKARRVFLRVKPAALLRGKLQLSQLEVEGAALQVRIEANGRNNLPRLPESDATSSWDFLIQTGEFTDLSLIYEDLRARVRVAAQRIHLAIRGDLAAGTHAIEWIAGQGEAVAGGQILPWRAEGRIWQRADSLAIQHAAFSSGQSNVQARGEISLRSPTTLKLTAETRLELAAIGLFAGFQGWKGGLDANFQVSGPVHELVVRGRISSAEFAAFGWPASLNSEFFLDGKTRRLRVEPLQIRSPLGQADVVLDLALGEGNSRAVARFSQAKLEAISQRAGWPLRLASTASAVVTARWPGFNYRQARAELQAVLKPVENPPRKRALPLSAAIQASLTPDAISIQIPTLRFASLEASGRISIASGTECRGEIELNAEKLDRLLQAAAEKGLLPQPAPKIEGRIAARGLLSGSLVHPLLSVDWEASEIGWNQYSGAQARGQLKLAKEKIEMPRAEVSWAGQKLSFGGQMERLAGEPVVQLQGELLPSSLAGLLEGAGQQIPLSGVWSAQFALFGPWKAPQVSLHATASELVAYGQSFGSLELHAHWDRGVVSVKKFSLQQSPGVAPAGGLEATASYNVAQRIFQLQAEGKDLALHSLTLPDQTRVAALVNLRLSGGGAVEDPRLDAAVEVDELRISGRELGEAKLAAAIQSRKLELRAEVPALGAQATSVSSLESPFATEFEVRLRPMKLDRLPLADEFPVVGELDAVVRGWLELARWDQGRASLEISRLEANVRGESLRNEGILSASWSDGRIQLAPAALRWGDSTVRVQGQLPWKSSSAPGSIQVDVDLNVEKLPTLAAIDTTYQARGRMKVSGTISGSLERMMPQLEARWEGGGVDARQLGPVEIERFLASVTEGGVRLEELVAGWKGARLRAEGEVPLALLPSSLPVSRGLSKEAWLRARLQGLDLRALPGVAESLAGAGDFELYFQAPALRLEAITGQIKATRLRFQVDRYGFEQQGESVLSLAQGKVRIEHAVWSGPQTRIVLRGEGELKQRGAITIRADGDMDLAVLSPWLTQARVQGPSRWRLVGYGTSSEPKIAGFFEVKEGRLSLFAPQLEAEHVALRAEFTGDRVELRSLRADLNGGQLEGSGQIRLAGSELAEGVVKLQASGVYLNYPEGLKTVSDAQILLEGQRRDLMLAGTVEVAEGSYTDPLTLETGVVKYLRSRGASEPAELAAEESFRSRLKFDLRLVTRNPVIVDNNLAQASLQANLRLVGSLQNPALTGRLEVEEGGKLLLAERRYLIERGVITFADERRLEPLLDLSARTKVNRHEIQLLVQGGLRERLTTTFSSDPPLAEEDIASLLVTGRTLEEARGAGATVAKEQALSLLAGSVGGTLSSRVQRATGISQFRVEPGLIAPESNPTARLTIGQDLARGLSFVYSMNLTDSRDQIYVAQWETFRNFVTRGVRQSDASFRLEFNHDIRLGGPPAAQTNAERMRRVVGQLRLTGEPVFTEREVWKKLRVKTGRRYDFFILRNGVERLEKSYAARGLLEAQVRVSRQVGEKQVDLDVLVHPGPVVRFVFEGWQPPAQLREELQSIWRRGVFDTQRLDEAARLIRRRLAAEGFVQAVVTTSILASSDAEKQVRFEVTPGSPYRELRVSLEGASETETSQFRPLFESQKLGFLAFLEPEKLRGLVESFYRERGYRQVRVSEPEARLEADAQLVKMSVKVDPGPLARIGDIVFRGYSALEEKTLRAALPFTTGTVLTARLQEAAVENLRNLYGSKGYLDSDVRLELVPGEKPDELRLAFEIQEGLPSRIAEIEVRGNSRVSENLIRSQLPFQPGDAVVVDLIGRARRDLYATGAFALVEIERQEMEGGAGFKPVRLVVRVREVPAWDLRYGAYFDTERGPGGIADFSNRNSLGQARVLGFRGRYDADLHEGRLYFSQPLLKQLPLKTVAATFFRRELQPAFRTDRIGFSLQQESRLRGNYLLSLGYRLEQAETVDRVPDPILGALDPIVTRIAPLAFTFTRDTRDDYLDATRGSLVSHAFEYAPAFLGSQLRYTKYYGQYFQFVPLTKPVGAPLLGGPLRSRWVYAGAVRLGLARGLGGQTLIPSERFFAGGGTTIRGFAQNSIGPVDFAGGPRGGDAVFVTNQELRFPIYKLFEGVGFADLGNVYPSISEFRLSNLRKAAGVGLRIRTPYFLLRFDYGFKLDRRPGEGLGRLFFSIGQAF
ncbi:MAG: translocation/assembly module TamB domain-containing protein [Bryobacteraceae bacterium]|nr:translocation/assembly module TamB domain-containing protein [Bryobacteraceae bacterium]MDW8379970.1 translocation/assembly module TamB domain-containing protein [Bryobacterales bacterium]